MSDIDKIKELREHTGVSIMLCRKALEETGGDFDKALQVLRAESEKSAMKRAERGTSAGVIDAYVHSDKSIGVIVEVRSETDFVAKNEGFQKFAHDVAMHIAAMNPSSVEDLLGQQFIKNQDVTIEEHLKETIQKFGENIEIAHFERLEL